MNAPTILNLSKGGSLNLAKGIPNVSIGCGWEARGTFDLDLAAFCLSRGQALASQVLFYQQKELPGLSHSGDNRTGAGDGDDETIKVNLRGLPEQVDEIRFVVNIYQGGGKTFADVDGEFVRIYETDSGKELGRYVIGETRGVSMHFCTLKRSGDTWAFVAVGEQLRGTDLNQILTDWS